MLARIGRNMVKYSAGIAAKSSSLPMGGNVRTMVLIRFKEARENKTIEIDAPVGKTLLEIALDNDVDIEGACGGELACSTCHVVMDKKLYDSLPEKKEEEDDMLDLAWGLTDTSRLCCQIKVTEDLEGAEFVVPAETNNMLDN